MPAPARAPATTPGHSAPPASAARAPTATPVRSSTPSLALPLLPGQPPAIRLGADTARLAAGGPGEPLTPGIRTALETSFRLDLGAVRVHQDSAAQQTVRSAGARALAFGPHIYLGSSEQSTDLGLMAHEAAHVVQQQSLAMPQAWSSGQGPDRFEREAHQASLAAVQHGSYTVSERTGRPRVQPLGLSDILDGLAELAANLPGFTLLTVIIGRNPINLRPVERNFTNLLRGFMGLILGGEILFQVLNRYGVVERIGNWVSAQVAALGLSDDDLRRRFTAFTDSLSWRDIFSPGDVWRRAQNIFSEPVNRIRAFISRLISQAVAWLKETFMPPLSDFCRQIPGYTLVTVLLGRDPFTNAPVPRTALNVVRAFAEFIPGGTEKVNQLVESRALQRAYEWFSQETQARNLTWARVTGTFAQAWSSLQLEDVLHPIETLQRIINMFRPLMSDLVGFAGAALMKLLEFIFEAAMGAGGARILAIIKRARDTFQIIIQNPVGFLRNLLGAVGQGVRQFMTNILRHLQEGVIAWLTGPVAQAGIQMPERWDLRGIIWFVLQILGLTWDRIRQKLVRLIGERAMAMLEAAFQLIQEIRTKGLVQALRDRVTEFFGQLREAALGSIRSFIQQRLVMAGITQLLSLLNPVGAVIQAIIKTYTTIQFFIQRINQILDLVESIVNSIAAIASGALGQAANFVERTMARTIPVILDFLARFIGLGDVGGQVQRTIQALQARVDQMLDRAVDWIKTMAQRLLAGGQNQGAAAADSPLRREVVQALMRSLGEETTLESAQRAVTQVRTQFASRGVRRVEIGPRDAQGNQAILIEASPFAPEILLALAQSRDSVNLTATVRFHTPQNLALETRPTTVQDPNNPGNVLYASHQAGVTIVSPTSRPRPATVSREPEREQIQSNTFQAVAYNTPGDAHAEANFVRWFGSTFGNAARDLDSIEIRLTHSPCRVCSREVLNLFRQSLARQIRPGRPTPTLRLHYDRPHTTGPDPTTVEDLAVLSQGAPPFTISANRAVTMTNADRDRRAAERVRARIIGQRRLD